MVPPGMDLGRGALKIHQDTSPSEDSAAKIPNPSQCGLARFLSVSFNKIGGRVKKAKGDCRPALKSYEAPISPLPKKLSKSDARQCGLAAPIFRCRAWAGLASVVIGALSDNAQKALELFFCGKAHENPWPRP